MTATAETRAVPTAAPATPTRDIPALTGLRGVAVLAVIGFHLQEGRSSWFEGGWAGVDIFFVLSGYLVTTLVQRDSRTPGAVYRRFVERRAARLLPALAVLVAVAAVALAVSPALVDRTNIDTVPVTPGHAALRFVGTVVASCTGVANLLAAHGVLLTPALGHLWSLDVEWQFYLLWPLFVLVLRPATLRWVTGALVIVAASYPVLFVQSHGDWRTVYFGTVPHLTSLGAGALVAKLPRVPRPHVVAGISRVLAWPVLLAVLLLLGDSDLKYRFGVLLVAAPTAVLVYSYVQPGVEARGLGHPVVQWVGDRSYGIYLWHFPLLGATAGQGPAVRLTAVLLAVVLAHLSLTYVEQPVRRRVRARQAV